MEYIYLIRVRESVRLNEPVYKIGRTKQEGFERFKGYPKGSELYHYTVCNDCIKIETTLLRSFREKYIPRTDLGAEYFEGDWVKMRDDIHQTIHNSCVKEGPLIKQPLKEVAVKPPKHTALYKKGLDLLISKKYIPRSQGPVLHFKLTQDHEVLYGKDDINDGKFSPNQEVVNQLLQKGILEVGNIYQLSNIATRLLKAKKCLTISNIDDWVIARHKQEGMLLFEYSEKEEPLSDSLRLKRYLNTTHYVNSTYLATISGSPKEEYYLTHLDFMSNASFTPTSFSTLTLKEELCKKANRTFIKSMLETQVISETFKTELKVEYPQPKTTIKTPLPIVPNLPKLDDEWVLLPKETHPFTYLTFKTGLNPATLLITNYTKQVIFGYEEYLTNKTVLSEDPLPMFDSVINERFLLSFRSSKVYDCVTKTLLHLKELPTVIKVKTSSVIFEHWLRKLVHSILVFENGYYIALSISDSPIGEHAWVKTRDYISKVIGHSTPPLSVRVIQKCEAPQIGLGHGDYVKAYSSRLREILDNYNLSKCLNSEIMLYPWML